MEQRGTGRRCKRSKCDEGDPRAFGVEGLGQGGRCTWGDVNKASVRTYPFPFLLLIFPSFYWIVGRSFRSFYALVGR